MRIMIREHIYDGTQEPIILLLTEQDKENINNMSSEHNIYMEYPDDMPEDEIEDLIKEVSKGQVFT